MLQIYLVIIALIIVHLFMKIEFVIFWELSSLYQSLVSLFISKDVGLSTSSSGYCSTPSGSGFKQVHIFQSSQDLSVSFQASELHSGGGGGGGGYSRNEQQQNPEQQIRRRVTVTGKTQNRSCINECDG
jgi:hypothetical protein